MMRSSTCVCALSLLTGACQTTAPGTFQRLPADAVEELAASIPQLRTAAVQAPAVQVPRPSNYVDVMFGGTMWNNLGHLDPTGVSPFPGGFGRFDDWGFAFDVGYDRVVAQDGDREWTLGLETGWSTFANSGFGVTPGYDDVTASMFYLTPAVRLMLHLTPAITVVPGIGAGYYAFNVSESQTYYYGWWWGYDSRTINQDSAFGGFGSIAVDFHTSPTSALRLENKVHFVDFGGLDSLYPNASSVDGPIWTIELGFLMSF